MFYNNQHHLAHVSLGEQETASPSAAQNFMCQPVQFSFENLEWNIYKLLEMSCWLLDLHWITLISDYIVCA